MEAEPMVSYSTGAMNSVVDKLTRLKKKHPMVDNLLQDLQRLREELLNKFVVGLATDEQVKVWMKQVRDLVYNIEDWIDPLFRRGKDDWIDQKLVTDLWESESVRKFKEQIQEARDRCTWYERLNKAVTSGAACVDDSRSKVIGASPSSKSKATIDSLLILGERAPLVGVDGPKGDLEEHLEDKQIKLKVVSVFGAGGIGKTNVAKEVYEKLKWQFECRAFVSIGRNTSTRTALMDILCQVNRRTHHRASRDEPGVISELWHFLRKKRYFIFIDDIRSKSVWRVISCALPDDDLGSRILTTTRVSDTATYCSRRPGDVIYKMKPLGEIDSTNLLHNTLRMQNEACPADFKYVCDIMLTMCGGMPLAIIVTAQFIARKLPQLGPQKLVKYLLPLLDQDSTSEEGLTKILEINFSDLPLPLKSCFLYMCIFPENYKIQKDRLIRRWIAEGLIPRRDESLWETGEIYINELIRRSLIQPVFDYNGDQPSSFTVHGVVLDFISSLSSQENFITAGAELSSGLFPCDTIRRFCLDCSNQDQVDTLDSSPLHLSGVRSLTVCGDTRRMPDIWAFRHVRVLDLTDAEYLENHQLKRIGSLSLLKYLGIGGTGITELPEEITAIEHLATIDVRRTLVKDLPAFRSSPLVTLLSDGWTIQRGIGGMEELEELSVIKLNSEESLDGAIDLVNQSKRLRILGVRLEISDDPESYRQAVTQFLDELGRSKLQYLFLYGYSGKLLHLLLDCWANSGLQDLQYFEMRIQGDLDEVPQKMAALITLTSLHISAYNVDAEGLGTLGNLPNLALLNLTSCSYDTQERLTVSKVGFQSLKVFCFISKTGDGPLLQFEAGAMPQLWSLRLDVAWSREFLCGDLDFGIQHLSCLAQVHANICCVDCTSGVVAAIRDQVSKNPNGPTLQLSKETEAMLYYEWQDSRSRAAASDAKAASH